MRAALVPDTRLTPERVTTSTLPSSFAMVRTPITFGELAERLAALVAQLVRVLARALAAHDAAVQVGDALQDAGSRRRRRRRRAGRPRAAAAARPCAVPRSWLASCAARSRKSPRTARSSGWVASSLAAAKNSCRAPLDRGGADRETGPARRRAASWRADAPAADDDCPSRRALDELVDDLLHAGDAHAVAGVGGHRVRRVRCRL